MSKKFGLYTKTIGRQVKDEDKIRKQEIIQECEFYSRVPVSLTRRSTLQGVQATEKERT